MRKPNKGLVLAVTLPLLAGCFATLAQPVPSPQDRTGMDIDGVVLGEGENAERVEFERVDNVQWTDDSLSIIGVVKGGDANAVTRTFSLEEVSAILVRGFDDARTSAIMAVTIVGSVAAIAFLLTSRTRDGGTIGSS